jgi:hypothetical protein
MPGRALKLQRLAGGRDSLVRPAQGTLRHGCDGEGVAEDDGVAGTARDPDCGGGMAECLPRVDLGAGSGESDERGETTPAPVKQPAQAAPAVVGSICSAHSQWGAITYQVCFSYNSDSSGTLTQGYFGLINNATTPRTVTWVLAVTTSLGHNFTDDSGAITLSGRGHAVVYSGFSWFISRCGYYYYYYYEWLKIRYDSAGWSPWIRAVKYLPC